MVMVDTWVTGSAAVFSTTPPVTTTAETTLKVDVVSEIVVGVVTWKGRGLSQVREEVPRAVENWSVTETYKVPE
jgi:hypothetical protein